MYLLIVSCLRIWCDMFSQGGPSSGDFSVWTFAEFYSGDFSVWTFA